MKLPWERAKDEEDKKKKDEDDKFELKAEDVKTKLDLIDAQGKDITDIKTKLSGLDAITSYIAEQRKEKEDAEKKKKTEKKVEETQEFEENLDFIGDPLNATKTLINKGVSEAISPLLTMTVNTQAKQLAKEHFSENPAFELYSDPVFKGEVDKLIQTLSLNERLNPASLENCYAVIAFRKATEIKEGKIKARFAASSSSSTGTGEQGNTQKELVLNADQKKAAAMFGMTEKEYGERFQKEHSIV